MEAMRILALDIATTTWWAISIAESGTWKLKPNRWESEWMRVVRFKSKVRELIDLSQIELVVYERPAWQHKSSIMVASEMIWVLKDLCTERWINYASYSASEIKKFATGKWNANKELMILKAKQNYTDHIIDDNHADALHLLYMVKQELDGQS